MRIKTVRKQGEGEFTKGKIYVNDRFECYSLEDKDRYLEKGGVKIYGKTAIPRGMYKVTIRKSNRFSKKAGHDVFLIALLDVPQFDGILSHSGNKSEDTDGCILTGTTNDNDAADWIGGSKIAYNKLHDKVKKALSNNEEVTWEIA